ncbi:acyltransferase ChoActase/COT/CPT [Syncephalis fuscata]|nr:acyltransferase ChoActase/COT/CPT [Syncephalis fuscata]
MSDFIQNQLQLPRLPLPQLDATFAEYLRILEPLLTDQEFEDIKHHVADFLKPNGFGERLQRRLKDSAVDGLQNQGSWLYDMATNYEFLECRTPLLVRINTFTLFCDDPTLAKVNTTSLKHCGQQSVYTVAQLKRAARLINGFLDAKDNIENGNYPEKLLGTGSACLHQYQYLFGVTRIPKLKCDQLRGGGEQKYECRARHITVIIDNQIYCMPVYAENNTRVTDADLEYQLWKIVHDVETRTIFDAPVCIWTGTHRDQWTMARQQLIDTSDKNLASLHSIEQSLFVVALDRFSGKEADQGTDQLIAGLNASHKHGLSFNENRWFDKSFSLVIERDGRAGMQCEHAACDGLVPSKVAAQALTNPVQFLDVAPSTPSHPSLAPPKALHFELDEKLYAMLSLARKETEATSANSDACCLQFCDYGSNFIKSIAKLSPDAYIEMAFQLAFFRRHNEFASACESIGMRGFLKGRTEIGRVFSKECRAWCEAMLDPSMAVMQKRNLLEQACLVHKDMIKRALNGEGASWHLHALMLMCRKDEEHPVFTSAAAKKGDSWRLYAGSLNSADKFYCGGFAAPAEDGYGIGYHFRSNSINIGIECERKCPETDAMLYRNALIVSLREMANICLASYSHGPNKAM